MSTERVGEREVNEVTHRVLHTWQLLGLAIKGLWLARVCYIQHELKKRLTHALKCM